MVDQREAHHHTLLQNEPGHKSDLSPFVPDRHAVLVEIAHVGVAEGEARFTIFDFGCGPGRDLKVFADLGIAVGLEGAARFCRQRLCVGSWQPARALAGRFARAFADTIEN